ncbi:MAG: histidine phosphatase family protein [Planctomycetota bacterium]
MMAKQPEIQLLVFRSASTEWDDAGRLQGKTDLPIGEGIAVSANQGVLGFVDALPGEMIAPATVHCASDEASRQTARMVADAFGGGVKVKAVSGLSAMDFGLWEGLLGEELEARYPRRYKGWREDPSSVLVPEGESFADGQARVLTTLAKLADKANGSPVTAVLRPFEFALLGALLDGRGPAAIWDVLEDGAVVIDRVVHRSVFRELLTTVRAVA